MKLIFIKRSSYFRIIILLLCSYIVRICFADNVTLSLLKDPLAKCLDGSQAGYYYQPSSVSKDNKKWVIYLNGGGECDNEHGCIEQTHTALGSSKYFKEYSDASGWFAGSDDCEVNPLFCGWNHVFNPYCSQDLHSGQMATPSAYTWGLQFSGHHVIRGILDAMDEQGGLTDADEIIVSGASAGGLGVWMNVDYIAQRYPNAKVTGLSIAGFYFYATFYTGPGARTWDKNGTMADFRKEAWPRTFDLYSAHVNKKCEAYYNEQGPGYNGGPCMQANQSFPFVQSPVFVVQSLSDEVVLQFHDMVPDITKQSTLEPELVDFMKMWSHNMTEALLARDRQVAGIFAAACWLHTGFNSHAPLIDGTSWRQAFNEYYTDTNPSLQAHVHIDSCADGGILCNPTCPT